MRTAVVILNWNTRDYLERWLPALDASCRNASCDAGVVVADNASSDGSASFVRGNFPDIPLIRHDDNLGFTGGYNLAVSRLLESPDAPEYIVLINSDVEVADGWLDPLVEWMDNHPECGVCGPLIHSLAEPGTFEYAGAAGGYVDRYGYPFCRGRVPGRTEADRGQYGRPCDVLWVSGACMLTRASLWKRLCGLDDRFFAHMEEIDYCWRAALCGFRVTVVPESSVLHLGGGSLPQESPFKLKLNYRNNLLLLDKNLPATIGPAKASLRIFIRKVLDGMSALAYLLGGRVASFRSVLEAHREYRGLRLPRTSGGSPVAVTGYVEINILLQTVLRRGGIFGYLQRYEKDSH